MMCFCLLAELVVADEKWDHDVAERQQRTWRLLFVTRQTIDRHVNILTYIDCENNFIGPFRYTGRLLVAHMPLLDYH